MNKKRIRELILIGIIIAVYNLLVFVIPFKRTNIFAISYVFVLIAIFALAASYIVAFAKAKSIKNIFLGLPITKVGLLYFKVQLVLSTVFMILSTFIPIRISSWIAIVPFVLILAFATKKATVIDAARGKIEEIGERHEANVTFIRTLRADLESLSERISEGTLKLKLSKLSDAVKYSDPVSNDTLAEVESRMTVVLNEIKSAVYADNNDIEPLVDEFNNLLIERNKKCKTSKSKQAKANSQNITN